MTRQEFRNGLICLVNDALQMGVSRADVIDELKDEIFDRDREVKISAEIGPTEAIG